MPTLGDVCARYGAAYIRRYGDRLPKQHRRVLQLLADCGTGRLGAACYRCAQCRAEGKPDLHFLNAPCGNRHCPNCQTARNGDWCVAQAAKLLPCDYFFVTFTLPQQLRAFVRSHQNVCYRAMFDAAAFALKTVLANPKFCGADVTGFTAVLHTFGRDMTYHPHVHVIVPAGGLRNGEWKSTLPGFLAPVKLLSKLFRMEFERRVAAALGAPDGLPDPVDFRREFVCDVEPVGDGVATLKYLSRYVYRTAITNDRIESIADGHVTFRYRRTGQSRDRRMRLPAFTFLHRFLQHVLPKRFHKVRHYGFLSRRSKTDLDTVRTAILKTMEEVEPDLVLQNWHPPVLRCGASNDTGPHCPACGRPLTFDSFHRIRPPPLEGRSALPLPIATRFEPRQS